jgi:hypothetical protein
MLSDANGLPLLVGVSAANTHDSQALQPIIQGLPAIRSRRGPRRRTSATAVEHLRDRRRRSANAGVTVLTLLPAAGFGASPVDRVGQL